MLATKRIKGILLGLILLPIVQACVPLAAVGMFGGALSAVDRRSLGTQTEDGVIEWKADAQVRKALGDVGHINYTSFNRKVLISGEVKDEASKIAVGQEVVKVANVKSIHNELRVAGSSSLLSRTSDSYLTGKVKTRLVDADKELSTNSIKVVTEAGVVFLMGIVSAREAQIATQTASTTAGVSKVISIFEIFSDEQIRALDTQGGKKTPAQ